MNILKWYKQCKFSLKMEHYKIIKVTGDGTYGVVSKAINNNTGEIVAIKKMRKKFLSWEECMQLREIKSLKKLIHPNIVKLKEVIRVNDFLHMVFEYAESNLYQVTKQRTEPFSEQEIKSIAYQTLQGIAHIHKHGFFHRDLKPENLLLNENPSSSSPSYIVKICDFGQAREIRSTPPYTEYIATRWYRAPECLLRSNIYSSPMDMFALGCIIAELYLNRPLFPGTSENDQLFRICSVLGTPNQATWPEGLRLGSKIGYQFPNFVATPISAIIPNASKEAIDLVSSMIRFDPQTRITAAHALAHPYFATFAGKDISSFESNSHNNKQAQGLNAVISPELPSVEQIQELIPEILGTSKSEDESIKTKINGIKYNEKNDSLPIKSNQKDPEDIDDISDLLESQTSTIFENNIKKPEDLSVKLDYSIEDLKEEDFQTQKNLPEEQKFPKKINDNMESLDNVLGGGKGSILGKPPKQISKPLFDQKDHQLSVESNFAFHMKHLGVPSINKTGATGAGLRAAASNTYKKELHHSFHDTTQKPFAPINKTHLPPEESTDEWLKIGSQPAVNGGTHKLSGSDFVGIQNQTPTQVSAVGEQKYQINYGRYKYQ